jgi:hypothetical protein
MTPRSHRDPHRSRGCQTLDPDPIACPEPSGTVELGRRNGVSLTTPETRLWKWRSRGNHRTISTGPWKSRTDREISTFPQPSHFEEKEDEEDNGKNTDDEG